MIELIPVIVTGGVVKKFSEGMLGKSSGCVKKKSKHARRRKSAYPSKNRPF